jgi:hypothetical protein
MTTAKATEYRKLAVHYGKSAERARDAYSRHQLQMLADNYMSLAKSTQVLNRSAKFLEALKQRRKK